MTDPKEIAELLNVKKGLRLRRRPQGTPEQVVSTRKEKRRVAESTRRMRKSNSLRTILQKRYIMGSTDGTIGNGNPNMQCGRCGMFGHIQTNKSCPLFIPKELVEVDADLLQRTRNARSSQKHKELEAVLYSDDEEMDPQSDFTDESNEFSKLKSDSEDPPDEEITNSGTRQRPQRKKRKTTKFNSTEFEVSSGSESEDSPVKPSKSKMTKSTKKHRKSSKHNSKKEKKVKSKSSQNTDVFRRPQRERRKSSKIRFAEKCDQMEESSSSSSENLAESSHKKKSSKRQKSKRKRESSSEDSKSDSEAPPKKQKKRNKSSPREEDHISTLLEAAIFSEKRKPQNHESPKNEK